MTKELNRKALYDLVWSKPMSTIAKDYGLSDRGMAKLCERNSIPVPPRGYWAKKAAGQKVHKPPLVVLDPQKPDTAIGGGSNLTSLNLKTSVNHHWSTRCLECYSFFYERSSCL